VTKVKHKQTEHHRISNHSPLVMRSKRQNKHKCLVMIYESLVVKSSSVGTQSR